MISKQNKLAKQATQITHSRHSLGYSRTPLPVQYTHPILANHKDPRIENQMKSIPNMHGLLFFHSFGTAVY